MSNEDWGESRWEFTKSKSKWHFDPSTKSKDYQEVCTFDGEWHEEVFECLGRVEPSTWASRNKFDGKERIYSATQEENDLIKAGANPKIPTIMTVISIKSIRVLPTSSYLSI